MLHKLFPTYVLHEHINLEDGELDKYKDLVYQLRQQDENYNPHFLTPDAWSSYSNHKELHKEPVFRKLTTTFLSACTRAAQETIRVSNGLDKFEIKDHTAHITNMWANIYGKGGRVLEHIHQGSTFAGLFYLNKPKDTAHTYYIDPLEYSKMMDVHILNNTTGQYKIIGAETGDLVIWPAYMKHGALVNESDEDKVIISFNCNFYSSISK